MNVVVFGTYDQGQHPRVLALVESLESLGHEVIRCNEPLNISTEDRLEIAKRPWRAGWFARRLLRCWLQLIRCARQIGRDTPDVVFVGYLGTLDVHLARLCFSAPLVLDNMAPLGGIASDRALPLQSLYKIFDRLAASRAQVVVWDTKENMINGSDIERNRVVQVGAPSMWFNQTSRVHDPAEPVSICFFGLYTPLQGASTIAAAIWLLSQRDDLVWTLIGTGQQRAEAEATIGDFDRVQWVDWLEAGQLAATVAEHDICLGIFGSTPKAMRVVPNKVYQGAAAGCAIITSDTRPQREAMGEAAVYVPAGNPVALAEAIVRMVENRTALIRMQAAARSRALEHFSPQGMSSALHDILISATARGDGSEEKWRRTDAQ